MSSSVCRRLRGMFNEVSKPSPPKIKPSRPTKLVSSFPATSAATSKDKKLRDLVDRFKRSSKHPSFRRRHDTYETAVRRLAAAQKFSDIEAIIDHQKRYPDITREGFVIRLISLYGQAGMPEHALKLFDEMPELNCKRTIFSFNALLTAYVNAKKFDKIGELFKELSEKLSIQPDVVSYNIVIKALCEMGSLDSAVSAIDSMDEIGIQPNLVTYNTVLDALSKSKKLSLLEKVWSQMESRSVVPNVRSFTTRIRGLVSENQFPEALELLEEMEKNGLKPDIFTYNVFIKGYVDDGNLEEAKMWYGKLAENGCSPDHVTFRLLIPLACEKDEFSFVLELCKKSIDLEQFLYDSTLQRVVDKLVEQSKVEEAKELVELGNNCSLHYRLNC
ncbi:pentatricopeptide repeat-containing protein At3g13150-like isoform X1 [Ipomoea triloba]|uniref:pentatricopeptide repeat-containing protein At3g13150-like isoform X1 n=1 Tax=Ipomoea triloba TaxID=35885 RepID=UPI00125DED89|nr:pentatricopeptide repeat-containing protein At3g13150-like isoform X1 [Ipomoea triloba]